MSKIYVLYEQHGMIFKIVGAVSNLDVANKFEMLHSIKADQNHYNFYKSTELDDPELLNRIAKESERSNVT